MGRTKAQRKENGKKPHHSTKRSEMGERRRKEGAAIDGIRRRGAIEGEGEAASPPHNCMHETHFSLSTDGSLFVLTNDTRVCYDERDRRKEGRRILVPLVE